MASSVDPLARWRPAARLGRLISRARRRVWSALSGALSERGESILDWQIVNQLALQGPSTQRVLAESIGQHPAGVSRQLEDLEEKGLTVRALDTEDRRCRKVALTAKGRKWHERHRGLVAGAVEEALSPLSGDEQRTLQAILEKLLGPERVDAEERTPSRSKSRRQ